MSRILNEAGRYGDWMDTYDGRKAYPLDPREEDFSVENIAHSLSQICRYNGHTDRFYSVAEHSCLVAQAVKDSGGSLVEIFLAVCHELGEHLAGDKIRPIKYDPLVYPVFKPIEDRIDEVGFNWLGLPTKIPAIVKEFDIRILHIERKVLFPRSVHPWNIGLPPIDNPNVQIQCYLPVQAEKLFLSWYHGLVTKLEQERVTLQSTKVSVTATE